MDDEAFAKMLQAQQSEDVDQDLVSKVQRSNAKAVQFAAEIDDEMFGNEATDYFENNQVREA